MRGRDTNTASVQGKVREMNWAYSTVVHKPDYMRDLDEAELVLVGEGVEAQRVINLKTVTQVRRQKMVQGVAGREGLVDRSVTLIRATLILV